MIGTIRMNERDELLSKVPAITLGFWIVKILATTLGETGGDTVTMSWLGETTDHPVPNGYLIGTALFGVALIVLVWLQIRARRFNPWLYWATIVASTTCGTTLADFCDRSLGIGYPGGSLLLLACVLFSLFAWHRSLGTVNVNTINSPRPRPSIGSRSPFRRRLAPRSATGRRTMSAKAAGDLDTAAARWCSAADLPCWRSFMHRGRPIMSHFFGRHSSSRARSEQRSATSSTSRVRMEDWRLAGPLLPWSWRSRSSC